MRIGSANVVCLVVALVACEIAFAAGPPTVQIVPPGAAQPPIQAGGAAAKFTVNVANDQAGDLPTVTSFTLGGIACTAAICGSFSAVTGTAGSGSYSMTYTPPANVAAAISPTVTVAPSLSGQSFAGTVSFTVYPAGLVVALTSVTGAGGLNVVQIGSGVRTVTFTTYNDAGNAGVALTLTGSGYACQNLSPNSCGTLVVRLVRNRLGRRIRDCRRGRCSACGHIWRPEGSTFKRPRQPTPQESPT